MFTQRCFIRKNSEDLRKKLGLIGKRSLCTIHDEILTTYLDCHYSLINLDGTIDMLSEDGFIDCGTNEELFLAIAALRDDSDKHQLFTNGKEWIQCEKEDCIDEISSLCVGGNYNYDKNGELSVDFHKATVEELIKHFNK